MNLNRLTTLFILWLEWTVFHSFLIGVIEDVGSKLVLALFYVWIMIGIIITVRMEFGKGKKNL